MIPARNRRQGILSPAQLLTLQKCNNSGGMAWVVELLDDRVRDELDALPPDMQARFRKIVELIQGYGLERVHEPHVKHLEGPLWEMRMKGRDGISRAVYVHREKGAVSSWSACSSRKRRRRPGERLRSPCNEPRRYRINETHDG